MKHIVALSGGKDSTALALRLAEIEPREYIYLCTPTGNELPAMVDHWNNLERLLGQPLLRITNQTLEFWIGFQKALPNHRMRWCTRQLKIEPCLAYLKANQPAILYVGLRADEEERQGIYSEEVKCRFPLREWGWGEKDVWQYLDTKGIAIPQRTDCAWCYDQRLVEWKRLYQLHPKLYQEAVDLETKMGKTFRSPSRDTWPARLSELSKEFDSGRKIRGEDKANQVCRVCKL